jgi:hypothetical protein
MERRAASGIAESGCSLHSPSGNVPAAPTEGRPGEVHDRAGVDGTGPRGNAGTQWHEAASGPDGKESQLSDLLRTPEDDEVEKPVPTRWNSETGEPVDLNR